LQQVPLLFFQGFPAFVVCGDTGFTKNRPVSHREFHLIATSSWAGGALLFWVIWFHPKTITQLDGQAEHGRLLLRKASGHLITEI